MAGGWVTPLPRGTGPSWRSPSLGVSVCGEGRYSQVCSHEQEWGGGDISTLDANLSGQLYLTQPRQARTHSAVGRTDAVYRQLHIMASVASPSRLIVATTGGWMLSRVPSLSHNLDSMASALYIQRGRRYTSDSLSPYYYTMRVLGQGGGSLHAELRGMLAVCSSRDCSP